MVGGTPPTLAPMSWFCASRRHSAAWKARFLCWEYALTARSMPPIVTLAGTPGVTSGYGAHLKSLNRAGLSDFIPGYTNG